MRNVPSVEDWRSAIRKECVSNLSQRIERRAVSEMWLRRIELNLAEQKRAIEHSTGKTGHDLLVAQDRLTQLFAEHDWLITQYSGLESGS